MRILPPYVRLKTLLVAGGFAMLALITAALWSTFYSLTPQERCRLAWDKAKKLQAGADKTLLVGAFKVALEEASRSGDALMVGKVHYALAELEIAQRDFQQAESHLRRALQEYAGLERMAAFQKTAAKRELERNVMESSFSLAKLMAGEKRYQEALQFLAKARDSNEAVCGNFELTSQLTDEYCKILQQTGETQLAMQKEIENEGNQSGDCEQFFFKRVLLFQQRRYHAAEKSLLVSNLVSRRLGRSASTVSALYYLAFARIAHQDIVHARAYLDEALRINHHIHDRLMRPYLLCLMAICLERDAPRESASCLHEALVLDCQKCVEVFSMVIDHDVAGTVQWSLINLVRRYFHNLTSCRCQLNWFLLDFGRYCFSRGNNRIAEAEAEEVWLAVRNLALKAKGPGGADACRAARYLAELYDRQQQLERAEYFWRQALKAKGWQTGDYQLSVKGLARNLREQNKEVESERLLREQCLRFQKEDPKTIWRIYKVIADVNWSFMSWEAAERNYRTTLKILQSSSSSDKETAGSCYARLASLLEHQQKFGEAERYWEQAHRLRSKATASAFRTAYDFASCLEHEHKIAEAERVLQETVSHCSKDEIDELPNATISLANFYRKIGAVDKAEKTLIDWLSRCDQERDKLLSRSLALVGLACNRQAAGQEKAAESYLRAALKLLRTKENEEHLQCASLLLTCYLAGYLSNQQRSDEAVELLRQEISTSTMNSMTAELWLELGKTYESAHKLHLAKQSYAKAMAANSVLSPALSSLLASMSLARIAEVEHLDASARKAYQQCLAAVSKVHEDGAHFEDGVRELANCLCWGMPSGFGHYQRIQCNGAIDSTSCSRERAYDASSEINIEDDPIKIALRLHSHFKRSRAEIEVDCLRKNGEFEQRKGDLARASQIYKRALTRESLLSSGDSAASTRIRRRIAECTVPDSRTATP